ncbi:MAG: secondary thiamine-phosphate synthase enzyme YjbQ [Deltaproteobacteria bacterium]|nr:secondary thiamine-phosphate synthase enzyme YjbQ [Deltaproteobacteria bacterium]
MAVFAKDISLKTKGNNEIYDITSQVQESLEDLGIKDGIVTAFVPGSTAGITTIEYEPGAVSDFKDAFERLMPRDMHYEHNKRWGDGNGFSHVRAAFCKASLTVPFIDRKLTLGTWQQIVLGDFDNRPRDRRIILQIIGE